MERTGMVCTADGWLTGSTGCAEADGVAAAGCSMAAGGGVSMGCAVRAMTWGSD